MSDIQVQIDGSSRLNPGPAGIGVWIADRHGRVIKEISRFVGIRTNNQAEYEALLCGLKEADRFTGCSIVVQTDSELVYQQMTGTYKVKNQELKQLHARAQKLLARLPDARLKLVPRELNKEADKLARAASAVMTE